MSIIKPKVFWPLTVTAANKAIYLEDFADGLFTGNIAEATYLSAETFRAAVQTAIRAVHADFAGMIVTISATGVFQFNNTAHAQFIRFKWATVLNSAAALLGFLNVNTGYFSIPFSADYQHANSWYSPVAVAVDSLPIRDRKADTVTRTLEGQTKFLTENELISRMLTFRWLPPEYTYQAFESTTAMTNRALERWWASGRSQFRYWPDAATEATYFDYVLDSDTIAEFKPKRQFIRKGLYEVDLGFFGYVA